MPKTIFHLIYDLDVGGTENMLLCTVPKLSDNFKNYVICFSGFGEIGKKLEEKNIPVFYLNYKGVLNIIPAFLKFKKLVKKYRPDVLSTYLPPTDIFGRVSGKILGIPKIVCNLRSTHKGKYKIAIFLDYLTTFLVDKYTINSPAIVDYYSSLYNFDKSKFTYIPNGIELSEYEISYDKKTIKEKLNLPPTDTIISCMSNLHIGKGHKYLLEAFEQTYKNNQKINLLIIGEGEEKNNLAEQTKNYGSRGNIFFLGHKDDVKELLAITDIFVLPTLFEGMSNALLEAMASKCAIITTDIPENKTLVKNNESGILVATKDSQKISEAIEYLIQNPRQREIFGKAAREKIKKDFELKKIVLLKWEKLYRGI